MERLRILHIVPSFGVGGAEQMAGHLMAGLSQSHEVIGVGLYPVKDTHIVDQLTEANIPLRHLGKRLGFDVRMFGSVDRVLREVRPQIVHTHLGVLRYALPALIRRRIPVVVHTLHNLADRETDAFGRLVHYLAFQRTVLPVAISQQVAVSLKKLYGLECRAIVPNCIPVERYRGTAADRVRWREKEGFDRDAVVFTCVGRLDPQKNHLLLIKSFVALNSERAHLVLMGDGELKEQLHAYVREHGLGHRVHLVGERSDVPECLAASDIFVLSSDWEGSPLCVMEAMAAGLPVVGTAVGGVPELVESGRHGLLVPPGNAEEFTGALRSLLDDPVKRAAMGCAARAHAIKAFSLERMVEGYTNFYQAALGASSRAVRAAA